MHFIPWMSIAGDLASQGFGQYRARPAVPIFSALAGGGRGRTSYFNSRPSPRCPHRSSSADLQRCRSGSSRRWWSPWCLSRCLPIGFFGCLNGEELELALERQQAHGDFERRVWNLVLNTLRHNTRACGKMQARVVGPVHLPVSASRHAYCTSISHQTGRRPSYALSAPEQPPLPTTLLRAQ